ncbi:MAG: hypothetical protein AB7F88_11830 [Pyrinomonadaceae bacterium]
MPYLSFCLAIAICVAAIAAALSACTPNRRIIESARTPQPPPTSSIPAESAFDSDLEAMRNADFTFILVFRRKDGEKLTAEDKSFVSSNTPDANRRRLSDDDKAVIIGSNFPFVPGTIEKLTSRLVMEDHSKPDAGPIEADRNANVSANTPEDGRGDRGPTGKK